MAELKRIYSLKFPNVVPKGERFSASVVTRLSHGARTYYDGTKRTSYSCTAQAEMLVHEYDPAEMTDPATGEYRWDESKVKFVGEEIRPHTFSLEADRDRELYGMFTFEVNAGRKRHDPATIRLLAGHLTEANLAPMQGVIAEQTKRGQLLAELLNAKIPTYAKFTWHGTEFTAYQKETSLRVTHGFGSGKYAVPNVATDDMLGAGLLEEWADSLGIPIPDELRDPAKQFVQRNFELNLGDDLDGPAQTYRTSGTPNGRISEQLWVILPDGSQVHPVCVTVTGGGQQHEFAAVPKTALVISWGFAGGSYYTQEWWNTIQAPPALSPSQKGKLAELEAKCHNSFYGTGCGWQTTAGRVQVEMDHRFLEGEAQEIYSGMFCGKHGMFYCNIDDYRTEWDGTTCKVFPQRRRGAVVAPTSQLQIQTEAPVIAQGQFSLHSRKTFKCETCAEAGRQGFATVDNPTWKQFNDEGAKITVQCANEQCRISGTVQKENLIEGVVALASRTM